MPHVKEYMSGQVVRLTAQVEVDDVLTDPTTLTFKVRHPDADHTVDTYVYGTDAEVVRDSIGVFHVDTPTDVSGTWRYRAETSGVAPGADEHTFKVIEGYF